MTVTYNSPHQTDVDMVRFHIMDTDVTSAVFTDEQITDAISNSSRTAGMARVYGAAASLLDLLALSFNSKAGGVVEKRVKDLVKKFASTQGGIQELADTYRLKSISIGKGQSMFRVYT